MKSRLSIVISLVIAASMLFAACTPATTTAPPAPQATTAPTTAVVEPTATTAAVTQPTATPAAVEPTATAAAVEPTATTAAPMTTRTGGWLDKIIFTAITNVEPAIAQLEAGTIDMWAVSSDNADAFQTVKSSSDLKYATVYGSNNQFLYNTTECTDKTVLNIYSDQAIREAMNWAIDRNYIVQEIMGGLAVPKYTALTSAFPDYARYSDVISAIQTQYGYNIDKAKQVVNDEMPKLGATQGADGKWMFSDKPVTVILIIRTEDKRKDIGQYIGNQLETLGFTVDRQLKTRTEASPIWISSDPAACQWMGYTAGWISTSISRDDGIVFAEFNSGDVQGIPAFNNYKPSPELKVLDDKLLTNNFSTMDERAQLFKQALQLSMKESWWGVWLTDNLAFEPYKNTVEAAADLAGGFASANLFPYTVRFTGKEGGELHIAQSGILVQPWNPINGSNWTDDAMVQNQTKDYGVVYNPYTGLALPKLVAKGDVVAKTGLPVSKTLDWVTLSFQDQIDVPGDAWADWDAAAQKFITVDEKAKADPKWTPTANVKSTVTYVPDLFKTKWHDGSNMSVGDFVMGMILNFDQGKKESKIYDESVQSTVETFLTHFKGVKIVSTDPLTIETYDDTYALDAENNVTTWYPTSAPGAYTYGTAPWDGMVPAILAEQDGKMAFSADKSTANKIDYTSFIAGPTLAVQDDYLTQLIQSGDLAYAPTMSQFVTTDEAKARYTNLQAWYKAHGHLWVGTGAYYIDQVFPTEGTISLARFTDYMFPSDQFTGFGEPMLATVSIDGPTQVKAGDTATFDITVNNGDQPYPTDQIDNVSYSVFNAAGENIGSGTAKNTGEGMYQIELGSDVTSKLETGASKLTVAVVSKAVSIPAIVTYDFVASK